MVKDIGERENLQIRRQGAKQLGSNGCYRSHQRWQLSINGEQSA
jgi:hypothetical protein